MLCLMYSLQKLCQLCGFPLLIKNQMLRIMLYLASFLDHPIMLKNAISFCCIPFAIIIMYIGFLVCSTVILTRFLVQYLCPSIFALIIRDIQSDFGHKL